jgi:hypothetical protein
VPPLLPPSLLRRRSNTYPISIENGGPAMARRFYLGCNQF